MSRQGILAFVGLLAAWGCNGGADPVDGGAEASAGDAADASAVADASSRFDATPSDAGPSDAGQSDATPSDATPSDAGQSDAGQSDASQSDAGPSDASPLDAAQSDASAAAPPDAGQPRDAALPCPSGDPGARPIIALEWEGTWETHLPPGFAEPELALDDRVQPPPRVSEIRVEHLVPERPVDVSEELCPAALATARLRPDGVDAEVIAARVIAGGDGLSRTALVTLPVGQATLALIAQGASNLDLGPGRWWILFEPATGPQRIWLAPAEAGAEAWTVPGVPDMPGTVALVRSAWLRADRGVTHAAPGFSSGWRFVAERWYAATILDLAEPVSLWPAGVDAVPPPRVALDGLVLDWDAPAGLVAVPRDGVVGQVEAPCGARLVLTPVGFVEADVGDVTGLGPPGSHGIEVECQGETTAVPIALRSMNGREGAMRLAIGIEDGAQEGGAP